MKIKFSTKNPANILNDGVYLKEIDIFGNEMISVNICGDHMQEVL